MRLSLTDDQQAVVDSFARLFEREATPERVRRAEPQCYDPGLWAALVEVGAPGLSLPVELGGGGGTLVDVALVAEQLGRRLAPAPLVEATVALRLLTRCLDHPDLAAGSNALRSVVGSGDTLTTALRPGRAGFAHLVPWGAVADLVVVCDSRNSGGARLLLVTPTERVAQLGLGAEALGDVTFTDATIVCELARGERARDETSRMLDDWKALKAAALVGLASEALALAVTYVKQRHQFGRPIGSFQALAHGLVDAATAVDGARLLALEAAWALEVGDVSGRRLASMAFAFAADTARTTTARALHSHGGYGFMEEYDVQLYHRRARSWALVHDSVSGELARLADTLWGD